MSEQQQRGRFTSLAIGLVIALMLASSASVAAAPTPVGVGVSTIFAGNGFTANESLSVWETGPDGTITPLSGILTDGNGGFTDTVSFPSSGLWTVTAHSINSGKDVSGTFAVGTATTTTTTTTTTSGPLPAGTLPAGIAVPVTFSGTGFTANEPISLWETGPDTLVTGLTGTQADGNGAFNVSVTFPTAGFWQVTAHGNTSVHEVIGRYGVGTTVGATTGTSTTTSTGTGFSPVPPVLLGTAVNFTGSGFNANESIHLWETAPDASVVSIDPINADGTGSFATTVTFPSVGNWQITAHGLDSTHEVIGRFTITSDASGTIGSTTLTTTNTTSSASTTVTTSTGTTISFMPSGFNAGEFISVWSTAPDRTVTTLDSTQASSTGRVIITASFATEGLWQITAHGRDSGREVIGRYQVSTRTTP